MRQLKLQPEPAFRPRISYPELRKQIKEHGTYADATQIVSRRTGRDTVRKALACFGSSYSCTNALVIKRILMKQFNQLPCSHDLGQGLIAFYIYT